MAKFAAGKVLVTAGIVHACAENDGCDLIPYLRRHLNGDWGDVSEDDQKENNYSIDRELRILSAYEGTPIGKIWIITEADRSVTTVLFPSEY